jgi:hypothetical protein
VTLGILLMVDERPLGTERHIADDAFEVVRHGEMVCGDGVRKTKRNG